MAVFPDGQFKMLSCAGLPVPASLNSSGKLQYAEEFVNILPGTTIMFMTDGLIEQSNNKEEIYGEERVRKILLNRSSTR